jgi:hypothetical protein
MPKRKERGARQFHKRLLHYINVNRTSLDHLLLGVGADVDKSVEWGDYSGDWGDFRTRNFSNLGVWERESQLPVTAKIRLPF